VSTLIAGTIARGGHAAPGWIEVTGEVVSACGSGRPPRIADLVHDGLIAPGLIDLQLCGAAGVEVTQGADALARIEHALLAHGVTGCLATIVTCEEDAAVRAVEAIESRAADPGSPILGAHLEGPFLSPQYPGVHRPELLRAPADGVPSYYHSPAVRLVTLAPELPGAGSLIASLRAREITVSLGHSRASVAQAQAAFAAGARGVTHLFNAMAPLHHREPGLAGAALEDERVSLGLIADGIHVHPLVLALVRRLAGARIALVSDASPLAAGGCDRAVLAGTDLRAGSDGAPRTVDGRLAGSSMLLDEAVRRWRKFTAATLVEAVAAGSEHPAAALGLPVPLQIGSPADLVLLDAEGRVQRTLAGGRWIAA